MSAHFDSLQRCNNIDALEAFTRQLSPKYDTLRDTYFAYKEAPLELYRLKDILEVAEKILKKQAIQPIPSNYLFSQIMCLCKNIAHLQQDRDKRISSSVFYPLFKITRTIQSFIDSFSYDSGTILHKLDTFRKKPSNRMAYNLIQALYQQLPQKNNKAFEIASELQNPTMPRTLYGDSIIQNSQAFLACNVGRKTKMQDDLLIQEFAFTTNANIFIAAIFAVFDGHGKKGELVAEYLKTNIIPYLVKYLQAWNQDQLTSDGIFFALKEACRALNEDLPSYLEKDGSTATIVLKMNQTLWCANVGDSRGILGKEINPEEITPDTPPYTALQITEDQSPEALRFLNKIHKLGGKVIVKGGIPRVGGRLAPARSFGNKNIPGRCADPKITTVPAEGVLVLATDGLFQNLASTDNVVEYVMSSFKIKSSINPAAGLINKAMNANAQDNLCALIVRFN